MSEANQSTTLILVENAHPASSVGGGGTATTVGAREYRKGNWTIHETMVLITAKKMDDERRAKGGERERSKTAELRWKWVENYCWAHGCMRSQNQCNDKWDNLLRDYKKVRVHEERPIAGRPSYWQMEKPERKERNLPSNLAAEVYEALHDVVNRKYAPRLVAALPAPSLHHQMAGGPGGGATAVPPSSQSPLPPPPPPPPPAPPQPHVSAVEEMTDSSETEGSTDMKRRKVRSLGSSILQSASVLSRALLACEEKKDERHRVYLDIEERKLQIEESRTEMNRQGFAGLISAVNNLSSAIHAIVTEKNNGV